MFVVTNKVKEINSYFHSTLVSIYPRNEIKNIISLLFEYYKGWDKMELRQQQESALSESELLLFHKALKRLLKNEPVQHIIGETEFFSLLFTVSKDVLIPRPETEELVDLVLKNTYGTETILDIGTGSGCIPIAIKKNKPNSTVFGVDISKKALLIAENNAKHNKVAINFMESDILKLDSLNEIIKAKLDVIISNPPYIPMEEKGGMHENVLLYDPELALFVANETPLVFYRKIGKLAFDKLVENGRLYFEINEKFGEKIVKLLKSIGFSDIRIIKDLQDKDRIIAAIR